MDSDLGILKDGTDGIWDFETSDDVKKIANFLGKKVQKILKKF